MRDIGTYIDGRESESTNVYTYLSGIVCKALKENGCSRGAIVSPEHVSHVGGLRIPHVTVNRDDGK